MYEESDLGICNIALIFHSPDLKQWLYFRLVVEGREDQELDLTKPLSEIKKTVSPSSS